MEQRNNTDMMIGSLAALVHRYKRTSLTKVVKSCNKCVHADCSKLLKQVLNKLLTTCNEKTGTSI